MCITNIIIVCYYLHRPSYVIVISNLITVSTVALALTLPLPFLMFISNTIIVYSIIIIIHAVFTLIIVIITSVLLCK